MSYYNYRWRFWKRIGLWLGLCALLLACGAAGGFAVGRYLYPHTALWDQAIDDLQVVNASLEKVNAEQREQIEAFSESIETPESAYYRGVMSACVGIGVQQGVPSENVAPTCSLYWKAAYERDWFNELRIREWQFPPEPAGD